jgi:hypothetical protein
MSGKRTPKKRVEYPEVFVPPDVVVPPNTPLPRHASPGSGSLGIGTSTVAMCFAYNDGSTHLCGDANEVLRTPSSSSVPPRAPSPTYKVPLSQHALQGALVVPGAAMFVVTFLVALADCRGVTVRWGRYSPVHPDGLSRVDFAEAVARSQVGVVSSSATVDVRVQCSVHCCVDVSVDWCVNHSAQHPHIVPRRVCRARRPSRCCPSCSSSSRRRPT